MIRRFLTPLVVVSLVVTGWSDSIPLPEHPRPDFQRPQWLNLNGEWGFRFDAEDRGLSEGWAKGNTPFAERIVVPFPWGSNLSGVGDEAHIAWYDREIEVPQTWRGMRVFLVVGACDWRTEGWMDGESLGSHQGGYTPFEFELTDAIRWGEKQRLRLRVDDSPHPFKLEGKQGYGEAKGIWQTVYLEARPQVFVETVHFTPDTDRGVVTVSASFSAPLEKAATLTVTFKSGDLEAFTEKLDKGVEQARFEVAIPDARLWSLEDPFLYEVETSLKVGERVDRVSGYFGMRKISVETLPGTDIAYVALNGEPVYLQMALDQSYHPDGYYTFPSDAFMRDEILRSKRIGLNGNRVHIKVEVPRKLYWADKLGLLIMADVPNFWGQPTPEAKAESEYALREMIQRDYNHPSIFSWVIFNETWGLFSGEGEERRYLPETQQWVVSMYRLAKELDPTRLVEDNSPCNYDHTETDLNTWHDYLPGYLWEDRLEQIVKDTYPGSKWNFIGEYEQGNQPLFNSECGNVWGYFGSAGDIDWTWDYHIMMNAFRLHPEISGWLYTEHHDVINEWNGYYRYDRSEKETGLSEIVPEMSLRDLHSPIYLSTGSELCRDVAAGEVVQVPLTLSLMTGRLPDDELVVRSRLYGWDRLGRKRELGEQERTVAAKAWSVEDLEPLAVEMPDFEGLAVLALTVESATGFALQRNFTTFYIAEGTTEPGSDTLVLPVDAAHFSHEEWSQKQWSVLDGMKVNGAGAGYFEYEIPWPASVSADQVDGAVFTLEASAKQLFGKDVEGSNMNEGDYMRGKGEKDPSRNPNAYPMTDTVKYPSQVFATVNGVPSGSELLEDDPADHRGILSWRAQTRYRDVENDSYEERRLHEAGSYGYLLRFAIPNEAIANASREGVIRLRLSVGESLPGGLAIYGKAFGRYPLDPTVVLSLRE